eukprot:10727784-Alexandrium_andersonii.AAC.1
MGGAAPGISLGGKHCPFPSFRRSLADLKFPQRPRQVVLELAPERTRVQAEELGEPPQIDLTR